MISKTESIAGFSSEDLVLLFLELVESPFEIEDCILLKREMISSWFNEFDDLLSGDGCILSSFPLDVFRGVASFEDLIRLLPSALMVERVEQ